MAKFKRNNDVLKLSAQIGFKHLEDDIKLFGNDNGFTNLVWPLSGEDPDEAFSGVPYEKGFGLLMYLESIVGSSLFETFAKHYIETFKFKTITSDEFKKLFMSYFSSGSTLAAIAVIDWRDLFYSPGMPKFKLDFSNSLSDEVVSIAASWLSLEVGSIIASNVHASMNHWTTQQTNIFLEQLLIHAKTVKPISETILLTLDDTFHFSQSKNSEIMFRWHSLCLCSEVLWIIPQVVSFLGSQGRMKFLRPLYRALSCLKHDPHLALTTFTSFQLLYHPIARKMVAQDIGVTL